MCVAWVAESRGPSLNALDELLLAFYRGNNVANLRLLDEMQTLLRLPPHFVKVISAREKIGHGPVVAVTGVGKITRLDSGGKGNSEEAQRGGDRLRPNRDPCHGQIGFRLEGDKSMSLDEIDTELSKTVAVGVKVKRWPEDEPEIREAMRGS